MHETKQSIEQLSSALEKFEKDFRELTDSSKESSSFDTLESLLGKMTRKTEIIVVDMFQRMLNEVNENELIRKKKVNTEQKEFD